MKNLKLLPLFSNQVGSSLLMVLSIAALTAFSSMMMFNLNQDANKALKKQTSQLSLGIWKKLVLYPAFKDYLENSEDKCHLIMNDLDQSSFTQNQVVSWPNDIPDKIEEAMDSLPGSWDYARGNDQDKQGMWLQRDAFKPSGPSSLKGRCDLRIHLKSKGGGENLFLPIPIICDMNSLEKLTIKFCRLASETEMEGYENPSTWMSDQNFIHRDSRVLIGPELSDRPPSADLEITLSSLPVWASAPSWSSGASLGAGIRLNREKEALIFKDLALYEDADCLHLGLIKQPNNSLASTTRFCPSHTQLNSISSTITGEDSLSLGGKNISISSNKALASGVDITLTSSAHLSYVFGKNLQNNAKLGLVVGENINVLAPSGVVALGENLKVENSAANSFLIGFGLGPESRGVLDRPHTFKAVFDNGYAFHGSSLAQEDSVFIDPHGNMGLGKNPSELEAADYPSGFSATETPKLFVKGEAELTGEIWKKGKNQSGSQIYLIPRTDNTNWIDISPATNFSQGSPSPQYRRVHRVLFLRGVITYTVQNSPTDLIPAFTLPPGFRFSAKGFIYVPNVSASGNNYCRLDFKDVEESGEVKIKIYGGNGDECSLDGLSFPIDL